MKISIKKYWIFINSIMIIVAISLTVVISNAYLKSRFKDYMKMNSNKEIRNIIEEVKTQYEGNGNWNKDYLKSIALRALSDGYILTIKQDCGKVVWDTESYDEGQCKVILDDIEREMQGVFKDRDASYRKETFKVNIEGKNIGIVEIGHIGNFSYGENELWFFKSLNTALFGIGIFLLLILGIIVYYLSVKISNSIKEVTNAAERVSEGDFNTLIATESNIIEIETLRYSINNMAYSLKEQGEVQKRITADAAHELRSPLATLQSHIEAMIDGVWEPTTNRLDVCHKEIIRLKRLVEDLWKLSKYESENIVINKKSTNISELVRDIKNVYSFNHDNNDEWDIEEDIYSFVDKDKLHQAIVNIVQNAYKYGAGAGIKISLKRKGRYFELSIKDQGPGIEEEDLPYIFDRFYRGDKTRERGKGGAGIGLTIAKKCVEVNDGEIIVNSIKNNGSKFIIRIPIR
ncbi:sensor histidine kinase [Oceanirhabdus sp. W0125-5]|uniref:sensor histidine kinase n=1 Tax=Oceanirhabdus sp. W0125-5 TaxID=2999116 RepID=UPI0022F322D1|nr:HAMP domain-containing sensor histidine kinase [Oceanirhabdus sp. W0125-5]WBW98318.1 HAMP domain-containing sensor histidine kinase [Oceanirhabdus sp. W0125-5]